MAVGFDVLVEEHLFPGNVGVLVEHRRSPVVRTRDRAAAVHAVLFALEAPAVVPPVAAPQRNRKIGLLGASLDFVENLLPQRFLFSGDLVDVGVLRLQIGDHLGIGLVAQPFVVVDELVAVVQSRGLDPLGHRSRRAHGAVLVRAHRPPIQSANARPEIRS